MALPIVSGSEVSTPSSGAPINPTAFRNAALQRGRVGEAIGQNVGQVFQQVSDKIQDTRNAKKVFDADIALSRTKDQFLTDIQKDPTLTSDPGKWLPAYKQRLQQTTEGILKQEDLAPNVRRHLSMMTQNFGAASTSEVQFAALKREVQDTKVSGQMALQKAVEDDRPDKYEAIVKSMQETGVIGPKVAAAKIAQFKPLSAESKANVALSTTDPHAMVNVPEAVKSLEGDINNGKKYKIISNQAQEVRKKGQKLNQLDWDARLDASPDHTFDAKLLKADLDKKYISQEGYDSIMGRSKLLVKADKAAAAKEDRSNYSTIIADMAGDNFIGQKNPQAIDEAYTSRISKVADPAMRAIATDKLNRKRDAANRLATSDEKPVHAEQLKLMDEVFKNRSQLIPTGSDSRTAPKYVPNVREIESMSDADFRAKFGAKAKRADMIEKAEDYTQGLKQRYADSIQAYTDWAHSEHGMKATPQQAADERERLGWGRYETAQDVKSAYEKGKIDRVTAKDILKNQFGGVTQ